MSAISWNYVGCIAAVVGLVGCGTQATAVQRSDEYMRHANYYQAYQVLRNGLGEAALADPAHRAVLVGYLLGRGQEEVFNDLELTAIETFRHVLDLEPGNPVAEAWIQKSKAKLADKATERGDAHRLAGQMEEAMLAYDEALGHVAGYPLALVGIEEVAKTMTERKDRAEDHYSRGLEVLAFHLARQVPAGVAEQLYGQTWYHMTNAVALDPEHVKAKDRREYALERVVRVGFERAKSHEDAAQYGAALREYLWIQERAPELESIAERVEHMRRELAALSLLSDAEMAGFKRDYPTARKLLQQAYETSISQRPRIVELQIVVKEGESEEKYQQARILEFENNKERALALFQSIDEEWQGQGFKDVKVRISGLEADIQEANVALALGQKAEQAGDWQAAVDAYQDALLYYPGFKELDAKVAELKQKLEDGA